MMEWIISSSVLIAAVWAGRALLKGKISLRLQYGLWALVLVRLLVPVSLFDSPISVQNVVEQQEFPRIYEDSYVRIPVRDYETAYEQVVQRYEAEGVEITPSREPMIQKEAHRQMNLNLSLDQIVKAVWLAGMAVMGIGLVASNAHFYLRLRRSRKKLEAVWVPVKIYITGAVRTPCLYGVFRPAIYVAPEVAADEKTLKYVLNHEVTHFRHFDHIWAALRSLCLVLHWYNPLVWVAAKLSRQDCEMACDEGTLMLLGEENRGDYGRTLVDLTCHAGHPSLLISATTMTGGKREMKERIVLLMKHPKTALITAIAVALCGAILIGCTFTGAGEATEPDETTPAETTTPVETTVPPESADTLDPVVVADEIRNLFVWENWDIENWYCNAMTGLFGAPEDVDLYAMFDRGYSNDDLTEDEVAFFNNAFGWQVDPIKIARITGKEMDSLLVKYLGVSLEQTNKVNLDRFYYYEPSDAYLCYLEYLNYGIFNDFPIEDIRVFEDGHAVVIYANGNDWYELILMKKENRWMIESNTPVINAGTDGAIELTKELRQEICNVVSLFAEVDEGETNPFWWALSDMYETAEDIDFLKFVQGGDPANIPGEEKEFLSRETGEGVYNRWIARITGDELDSVLTDCYGITLVDTNHVNLDAFYYYEPNDAYLLVDAWSGWWDPGILEVRVISDERLEIVHNNYAFHTNFICNATMVKRDGKWVIESNLPYRDSSMYTLPEGAVELTGEQLLEINEAFAALKYPDPGNISEPTWDPIHCFFITCYDSVENLQLGVFLPYCPGFEMVESDAELEMMYEKLGAEGWPEKKKHPFEKVDALLLKYTGVSLYDVKKSGWTAPYLEEYEAFYAYTSDAAWGTFKCVGGYVTGDGAVLYGWDTQYMTVQNGSRDWQESDTVLTLREEDGQYYIVSHLPLEAE